MPPGGALAKRWLFYKVRSILAGVSAGWSVGERPGFPTARATSGGRSHREVAGCRVEERQGIGGRMVAGFETGQLLGLP
jgi:hypothetical protein